MTPKTDAKITEKHRDDARESQLWFSTHGDSLDEAVEIFAQALANSERDGRQQADDAVCEVDLEYAEGCASQAIDEALANIRALEEKDNATTRND